LLGDENDFELHRIFDERGGGSKTTNGGESENDGIAHCGEMETGPEEELWEEGCISMMVVCELLLCFVKARRKRGRTRGRELESKNRGRTKRGCESKSDSK
jgi:hypothetical protein